MTALVKGSVARGRAPLFPEAHVIKYANGGAVELYGLSFSLFLRVRINLKKSASFKTFKQSPAVL